MKLKQILLIFIIVNLTACAITPAQKAVQAERKLRAEQTLSVELAKQCDVKTAELIATKFNPPIAQTEKEKKAFEQKYVEKVNNPMFQACYKLAWQNYIAQEEIRQLHYDYQRDYGLGFGFSRFCHACW